MKRYIIFGVSGYLSDIFDLIHVNGGHVHQIYANLPEINNPRILSSKDRILQLGYKIDFFDSLDSFQPQEGHCYALGFTTVQKYVLVEELKRKFNLVFDTLIHPDSTVGSNVRLGEGVLVNARSVIGPNAHVGDFCSINRAVSVGHDTSIGRYSIIAPSAAIAGSTRIGEKVTVGIHATILDALQIGDWAVIGAGSVVTRDVPEGVVAYGSPAKIVRENQARDYLKYLSKFENAVVR